MINVTYTPNFLRQFNKLPSSLQDEVEERIGLFQRNSKHPSLRVHKLKGNLRGFWSFSVNYECRIVFLFEGKGAALLSVGDHTIYD